MAAAPGDDAADPVLDFVTRNDAATLSHLGPWVLPALARAGWDTAAVACAWTGAPLPDGADGNSARLGAALAAAAAASAPAAEPQADQLRLVVVPNAGQPDYAVSRAYWAAQPPTTTAMLGGVDDAHDADVRGSLDLLDDLGYVRGGARALDCGAGVGRVARDVLLQRFVTVDLVDQEPRFLDAARRALPPDRVGTFTAVPLQDLAPPERAYDVCWVQWVMGYLRDTDAAAFLRRAAAAADVVVVKECVAPDWYDARDASIVRTEGRFLRMFQEAGLRVARTVDAEVLVHGLLPVKSWALAGGGGASEPS